MPTQAPLTSPRLAALRAELEAGNHAALYRFWREVDEQGTPLIEPIAGDDQNSWVTFLWRADEPVENVVLISELGNRWWWKNYAESKFIRLLDTNLWYRTYILANAIREIYLLSPDDCLLHPDDVQDMEARMATARADPLNPHRYLIPKEEEEPHSTERVWSILEMPAAAPQPWITPRDGVPAGNVQLHRMRSALLDNERRVWVYTPPGYTLSNEPYRMVLLFDGWDYITNIPTPTILDNVLGEGLIPPMVAIMVGNATGGRNRELNGNDLFLQFLTKELLPWAREQYHLSAEPAQSIVGGFSMGGVAAAYAALCHPEIFGSVLSQSGAFWVGREGDVEEEWLAAKFATHKKLPLRFYLEAGLHEKPRDVRHGGLLRANRHLRNVLAAKGYEVHYREFAGAHRYICWRGTFSDGLMALVHH